jgi:hypothetical protein
MRFRHFVRPLSRIFRLAPPSPPPPQAKVAALDEEELHAAAARTLLDGEPLRELAGVTDGASRSIPSNLGRIAQERMAQLIDAGAIDFAGLCVTATNPSALLSVAGLCNDSELLHQAVASIGDPQRVAKIATEGSSSRIRQLAAQSIEDPTVLRQLLKAVRGKDNGVYKIIKQKCNLLRAEEQRIAQIESDVNALCASLEHQSLRAYDSRYLPSLEQLEARWLTLEKHAAPELRARAHQAMDRCREAVAGHLRQLAQQAADASHQAVLQAAREEAQARAAEEAQGREELAALAAAAAAKIREAEEKIRAEKLAADALALRRMGGLVAKASSALRDGNTGRAAGLRRAIDEQLPTVPAVPAHLTRQVQQLDAKLNELKEWKDYAVAPKRAALIEEMEALIGSSEAPQSLADRIKGLQEDWKTISKGIVSDSEADWQRFHQAALSAYQPCREYFEAQTKQRQSNLEKRRGVLGRLLAFETVQGGEHPDWQAVAAVLREARQEWRCHFPVDRAAGAALQDQFDASIGRLQARLDAWYAQNAEEKRSLIQRAQYLRTKEDSREAVEAAKRLQLKWKEVGAARRDQEQQLWDEFREQCDAVYQKRHQAYAEYTAGLDASKRQAAAICDEAEQVAALSGSRLLEGAAKIPQWRAAFESLGEMPRTDQRSLHERFERALSLCRAKVTQHRARETEQSFTDLLEAARRIQVYGRSVSQGSSSPERVALKQTAETFISGVQRWPKGGAQALEDAWRKADGAAEPAGADQETALRMLCIRSEILTDLPTPAEDQALRRDYQVQRLVERMGQGGEAGAEELDALALEWARMGPICAETYESLIERFLRCRRGGPRAPRI